LNRVGHVPGKQEIHRMKYLLLPFLFYCQAACGQTDTRLVGTWMRLDSQKNVIEIFMQRPNGVFVSNGFDKEGNFTYLEKGKWGVAKDSITFSFDYEAECAKKGDWKVTPETKLEAVTLAFTLQSDSVLIIHQNIYHRGLGR
jgi:hypothetical protein